MKQLFSNQNFDVIKNGMSSTYSKPPYQEDNLVDDSKIDKEIYIKVIEKVKGRNRTCKIVLF